MKTGFNTIECVAAGIIKQEFWNFFNKLYFFLLKHKIYFIRFAKMRINFELDQNYFQLQNYSILVSSFVK